mgnify:CR=1 FL=1
MFGFPGAVPLQDLSSGNVLLSARPPVVQAADLHSASAWGFSLGASGDASVDAGLGGTSRAGTGAAGPLARAELLVDGHGGGVNMAGPESEEAQAAAAEAAARALIAGVTLPPVTAKIADFGLSARMGEGQTHASNCWQVGPIRQACRQSLSNFR